MSAADLIDNLASRGRCHFTTDAMPGRLGSPVAAARAALRRLQRKDLVATPHRGFRVVVLPELRRDMSWVEEDWVDEDAVAHRDPGDGSRPIARRLDVQWALRGQASGPWPATRNT